MKHLIAATLVTALPALAADKIITVTFDSIVNTPNKAGERLDPSLFSFGPKTAGEDETAHAQSSAFGKPKDEACRWALLGSFLKIQAKAKTNGKKVVSVRTIGGNTESDKAETCTCIAGATVVRSVIKVIYK